MEPPTFLFYEWLRWNTWWENIWVRLVYGWTYMESSLWNDFTSDEAICVMTLNLRRFQAHQCAKPEACWLNVHAGFWCYHMPSRMSIHCSINCSIGGLDIPTWLWLRLRFEATTLREIRMYSLYPCIQQSQNIKTAWWHHQKWNLVLTQDQ